MQFYTVAELTKMLKLSASQVYVLIESGKLRCHRFTTKKNGAVRVSQAQLDAYLKATESGEAPPEHVAPEQIEPATLPRSDRPSVFAFLPPKRT
jgi:excisionase family DNA binding protein